MTACGSHGSTVAIVLYSNPRLSENRLTNGRTFSPTREGTAKQGGSLSVTLTLVDGALLTAHHKLVDLILREAQGAGSHWPWGLVLQFQALLRGGRMEDEQNRT